MLLKQVINKPNETARCVSNAISSGSRVYSSFGFVPVGVVNTEQGTLNYEQVSRSGDGVGTVKAARGRFIAHPV